MEKPVLSPNFTIEDIRFPEGRLHGSLPSGIQPFRPLLAVNAIISFVTPDLPRWLRSLSDTMRRIFSFSAPECRFPGRPYPHK